MKKFLVDTCVWRDFYENRKNKLGKDISKLSSDFFSKVIIKHHTILFSDVLVQELKKEYSLQEINELLGVFKFMNILEFIEITKDEYSEAKQLSKERNLPLGDCIFAIQARNSGAILITRDAHFFKNLKDIANIKRPEDIN